MTLLFPEPATPGSFEGLLALASEAEGAGNDGHALSLCVKASDAATRDHGPDSAAAAECKAYTEALADRHVARTELSNAHRLRGNSSFGADDFSAAEASYDEALSLTPRDPAVLTNRAACLLKRHAWAEALADAELALRVDPKRIKAAYRGSQALLALNRPAGAQAMLSAALPHCTSAAERRSLEQIQVQVTEALASDDARASAIAAKDVWSASGATSDAAAEAQAAAANVVAAKGRDDTAAKVMSRRGARGVRGVVRRAANVVAENPRIGAIASSLLSEAHAAAFRADGHTSLDLLASGLVSAAELGTLVQQAQALHRGGYCVGGVQNETRWRDDTACWLTAASTTVTLPALANAISLLGCLAHELNERCGIAQESSKDGLGLLRVPEAAMFAAYEGAGSAYRPHRDNARRDGGRDSSTEGGGCEAAGASAAAGGPKGSDTAGNEPPTSALLNDRAVTLIIYLNDAAEWGPNGIDGGGELRIHQTAQQCDDEALFGSGWQGGRDGGGAAGPYVDVMPLAGRVALFRSELLHEVLPTCDGRLRLALSMWCVRLPV